MRATQSGFTLIELMIVVTIIGILAAIAIPAYQDYTVRAQVAEGLTLASTLELGVADTYANDGDWAADTTAAGSDNANPPSGKYVTSVTVNVGTVTILYGNQASSQIGAKTLSLQPLVDANHDVVWLCGTANPVGGLSPVAGASTSAMGPNTVAAKYTPKTCRP